MLLVQRAEMVVPSPRHCSCVFLQMRPSAATLRRSLGLSLSPGLALWCYLLWGGSLLLRFLKLVTYLLCTSQELGMSLVLVHYHALGGQWLMCINSSFLNTANTGSLSCLLSAIILRYTNQCAGTCSCDSLCSALQFLQHLEELQLILCIKFLIYGVPLKTLKEKLNFFLVIFSHKFLTASVAVDMISFLSMCSLTRYLMWGFWRSQVLPALSSFYPSLHYLEAL